MTIWHRPAAILLLCAVVLSLAACGSVPRPFRETAKTDLAVLPSPQPSAGLVLEPIQHLSGDDGNLQNLHGQVIRRLHGMEIAASALEIPNRYRISGTLQRLRPGNGDSLLVFTWTLLSPARTTVSSTRHSIRVDNQAWLGGDETLTRRVATEIAFHIDDLIDGGDDNAPVSTDRLPGNVPLQVAMAPMDADTGGALELSIAMRRTLRRNQVDVVDAAPGVPVVSVRTTVSRIGGGEDLVIIIWAVRDVTGRQRGQLKQQNRVPAGKLKFRWGTTAALAANAAAGDLIDLLRRLRQADTAKPGDD